MFNHYIKNPSYISKIIIFLFLSNLFFGCVGDNVKLKQILETDLPLAPRHKHARPQQITSHG